MIPNILQMKKTNALCIKTAEECGELIQAICKHANGVSNIQNIEHEIGDVLGCIWHLTQELKLDVNKIDKFKTKRIQKSITSVQKLG